MSGGGMSGGSSRPICVPNGETETGLEMMITFFTDDQCNDLLEIKEPPSGGKPGGPGPGGKDGRRLLDESSRGPGGDSGRGGPGGDSGRGGPGGKDSGFGGKYGKGTRGRAGGGNERQKSRITQNPTLRMVPVIDEEGKANCAKSGSRTSRPGGEADKYRAYTCADDNNIDVDLFEDADCTKASDDTPRIAAYKRGECIPLPQYSRPEGMGPGHRGEGEGRGPGGKGPGPGGKDGRRAETDTDFDDDDEDKPDTKWGFKFGDKRFGRDFSECDSIKSLSGGENRWSSIDDFLDDLTCVDSENSDEEVNNPCEDLKYFDCKKTEDCEMQNRVCVWTKAPTDERNLYVIYDWKFLTKDGKVTEETWCYDDGKAEITSRVEYEELCEAHTNEGACGDLGCNWKRTKRGAHICVANRRVKCKKLTELNCGRLPGCNWIDSKDKCTGKAVLP